nr:hypothetical protein [uncultured Rhodopila sp.]
MAATRTFSSVSAELMERIRQVARDEHGILFDPPDAATGTATGRTPLGECIVHFAYDIAQAELVMTLVKKPLMLPAGFLWTAFLAELERSRGVL